MGHVEVDDLMTFIEELKNKTKDKPLHTKQVTTL